MCISFSIEVNAFDQGIVVLDIPLSIYIFYDMCILHIAEEQL